MNLPNYLIEDEIYIYCKKNNIEQIKALSNFIPLNNCCDDTNIRELYYNVIGFLNGKQVIIIGD